MKKLRYLTEYIIFKALITFLRCLGINKSTNICSYIARKIGPYLPYTKIARNNLQKAYKDQEIDIELTITDLWDNFGRYVGEFPFINTLSKEELNQRITMTGLENIRHLQQQNKPFLLFLGHQGNWDFLIRRITDIYPKFGIIYRKANNPYVDKDVLGERQNDPNITLIPKGTSGSKDLLKVIKKRHAIAMLIDQKMNDGIEVPFFNMKAMTAPAIARFSLKYDYPIVPAQIIRKGKTSNFEVIIHSPLKYEATGSLEKDCYNVMLKINKMLEKWIRMHPSQWFWFHNRWKD
ncbi:MAG: hypothetical protein DGJ47_000847 [Rickettsiaceae bacterium]